ncbi:MAG: Myb-like DNA-binding domain-containing protein [Clostridia bacterium]|nr:Myb-like DNA-binding domain-containing protein [Clostridia bacterium]
MKQNQARKWTEDENKFLISAIRRGNTAAEISKYLGRSEKSVQEHCRKLKIVVSEIKEKQKVAAFSLADVKCPFFEKMYRGRSVRCEGLTPASFISMSFSNEGDWQKQVKMHCNKDYQSCPFYQLLSQLYEK